MPRILIAVLLTCLALTGCGSDDEGGLSGVKVTSGDTPKLTVPEDFTATKSSTKVLDEGKGEKSEDGALVRFRYIAADGATGKTFDDSFASGKPTYEPLNGQGQLPSFFSDALKGRKKGSRFLTVVPPSVWTEVMDASALASIGVTEKDPLILYITVDEILPKDFDIAGTAVTPGKGAPKATFKDGKPTAIASADTPNKAAKYVLEEGTGKKLEAGGYFAAQYFGGVYPKGKEFDQSWDDGTAFGTSLDGVVKCWQDLMPGVQEGSRLLVVCPKDVAYGGQDGHALQNDTLMFVIDVIDVA